MKIGEIKVKRNYQIAQMVLDAVAFIITVVIVRSVFTFGEEIELFNSVILKGNGDISGLVIWQWNLIWIAVAAAVIAVSLVMIYKPRKMPKKYIVNKDNAQKYSDIVITAVTCVRIPALLMVFEGMYIHQSLMWRDFGNVFSLQIPLDILLIVIIVRFSIHRVRALQPKKDKEITLRED